MAMATREAPTMMRLPTSCYMRCLLFFVITVATVSTPALAGHSPPSTLELYGFQYSDTVVEVASPSGNLSASEFGSSFVVADPLRETPAGDSPVVGLIAGQLIFEKDFSIYAAGTYVLNTTSFTGSISVQGVLDVNGEGEQAITGGTYDFRWARGYVDITVVYSDLEVTVIKIVFQIKYD